MQNIARVYDRLASLVFGQHLRRAQVCFLDRISPHSRVLVLGGGSGWILEEILQASCPAYICYIDTSAEMIRLAEKKWQSLPAGQRKKASIQFVHGSEMAIPQGAEFDTILTFFVLDCYSTAACQPMMKTLSGRLKKDGSWLFADFRVDRHWHKKIWQLPLISLMYLFFRLSCGLRANRLPDFDRLFASHGMRQTEIRYFLSAFIQSSVYRPIDEPSSDRPPVH
jgi:ubiquinone/menaquinone biosynthesis C-methylase UbiE